MTGSRLQHLDGIRGIAAFAVFVCHFIQVFVPHVYYLDAAQGHGLWEDEFATSPFNIIVNGNFAVCLFFVLSGFVLSHRFLDTGDLDGWRSNATCGWRCRCWRRCCWPGRSWPPAATAMARFSPSRDRE